MTSPSETNSLPLKNGGLKDLPFWYGATWLVRAILVPKVPFNVMGILRVQKQCDTPPYWLGDWHRGQEDL